MKTIIQALILLFSQAPRYLRHRFNVRIMYTKRLRDEYWFKKIITEKERVLEIKIDNAVKVAVAEVERNLGKDRRRLLLESEEVFPISNYTSQIPKSKNPPPPNRFKYTIPIIIK